MSIEKILFSGPEGSANIEGLIAALKRTSPGTMARMEDSGGRIQGEPTVKEYYGGNVNANASRITQQKKC